MSDNKTVTMYMCGVDWQHEIGETSFTTLYASKKACAEARPCTEECGMVEVQVSFVKWVKPQDFSEAGK